MSKKLNKEGKVVTFYSYKGGVGRSMALANTAVAMAGWGYRILIIDWDLEAPGLENFYKEFISISQARAQPGLIDILQGQTTGRKVSWKDCLLQVFINKYKFEGAPIDLLTSGNYDDGYYDKVRSFDFSNFYDKHDGGNIIERLRQEWKKEYDFVFIDSRTGVTDIGGVCTIQLPDMLVLLFTPTEQGFEGTRSIAAKAMKAQKALPYDRLNLLVLPVATRLDNDEFKLSQQWIDKFETGLEQIYAPWLSQAIDRKEMILNTKVPYISYFSYGEKLPILEDGVKNPSGMGYAYQSIAALIASQLNNPELLLDNRSALINLAIQPDMKIVNLPGKKVSRFDLGVWLSNRKLRFLRFVKRENTPKFPFWALALFSIISVAFMMLIDSRLNKLRLENIKNEDRRVIDSLKLVNSTLVDSLLEETNTQERNNYIRDTSRGALNNSLTLELQAENRYLQIRIINLQQEKNRLITQLDILQSKKFKDSILYVHLKDSLRYNKKLK